MSIFTDNGLPIEIGTQLFTELRVGAEELHEPREMQKLREIADFLSDHPDPGFVIGSVIRSNRSPDIRNLDHLFGFIQLNKDKNATMSKLDGINNELKHYE